MPPSFGIMTDLTQYDIKPEGMINYLRYNGPHFSKKLAEWAISKMKKDGKPLQATSKQDIDKVMQALNISINNNMLYDYVYVFNMAKADFYGSSLENEKQLAKYVKDYIDDEDGYDGIAFNRFLADCARKGIAIDWESMI